MYSKCCPKCNKNIIYVNKYLLKKSIENNNFCKSCSNKFKKSVSDETKLKISKSISEKWKNDREYSESISRWNSRSYDEKFGKSVSDEIKNRKSLSTKGKNNPMYGKPSPMGSGNGWSGWYKGWFFRSLRELSYMINVIERFRLKWKSIDTKQFAISYKSYDGKKSNYFADFLINDKYIIEIKPKKLWNTPLVSLKKNAALKWCEDMGYKYKMIDPLLVSEELIFKLYLENKIKFLKRYEEKLIERQNNTK